MKEKEEKEKTIKVFFKDKEGEMKLTLKGKNAINNALKIAKAFDEACKEIEKSEIK